MGLIKRGTDPLYMTIALVNAVPEIVWVPWLSKAVLSAVVVEVPLAL